MPTTAEDSPRPLPLSLPDRPNLRHLKDQAKKLLRSGEAVSLSEAQLQIARLPQLWTAQDPFFLRRSTDLE